MSSLKLYSTCILTKKKDVSLYWVIVFLNATTRTHSANQLLISWNMHVLPAGAQWGALFPGDVARYGGGIQIMHCSKLVPCVFSLLRCRKNTVMAQKFQTVKLCDSETCALSQTFLHLFRRLERLTTATLIKPLFVMIARCIPVRSWWMDL